jgi:hypothetical protein
MTVISAPDPLDEVANLQPGDPQGGGETSAPPSAAAVAGYLASLPADQFPNITAVAGHFIDDDPGQRCELLIDLFVDGLAERAAPSQG